ncbi:Esterase/lipase-like protein [uncultured Paludibacter sp.]|nr:Esterase/lipase-like protein [uncultured Paludibacter sp.]
MKILKYILFFTLILSVSCGKTPDIDNSTMLDGNQIYDLSLTHPENYLMSVRYPHPTDEQKNVPVIIAAHGYSASTFEWDELRTFADSAKTFNISQVLLGGHGRTYADFKKATWKNWQSSIIREYKKLDSLGYKKIFLAGSSTGCPLIINMVKNRVFRDSFPPKGIFLIDPIIVSSNKMLTMVSVLGPILGYTTTELSTGEQGHWYVYRPQESLKQLMDLIDLTRQDLEKGIGLPEGTFMKTYKSKSDDVADPVSAVMIYKGMRTFEGKRTEVELVDSKLHVFTRLDGREGVTSKDKFLQMKTFKEMEQKMINSN